ncbi:outer membrane beta-barrel protein [Niabella beijingensis]|uniref:outer membrane beta-barrel protein n=1 Tax=Niabella beijingensis TaxID=2872700 RepID=UPI001CBE74B8|nr:outer membrane beta-barrel protein [Niabella beijingensis]MBZ4189428.1 TonB-dependent receptor [Niabella beijingensis]
MFQKAVALTIFIIIIIISGAAPSIAQNRQVYIQFKLENGQPAEKATILLISLTPENKVTALIADKNGIIPLTTDSMQYHLKAAFSNMEPIDDTVIADGKVDTLHYSFRKRFKELATVQVSSRKKILEVHDDRFIYNVSADSSARSKSVSQVLNNLPFVTVDGTGEVRVAGQSTYKVLLNGKETTLFVKSIAQALRSYPVEIVSRIELITAPGARYDAEGVTAIINIITKKFTGYKGFAIAYASDRTHFSDGLTVTGRAGKLGITLNTMIDGTWKPLNGFKTTVTTPLVPSAFEKRTVSGENTTRRTSTSGTLELNYEIDSLHSVIGYITADRASADNVLDQQVYTQLSEGNSENGSIKSNSSDKLPGFTAGLDYTQRSRKNPAKELSFRFNWNGTSNTIDNATEQQYGAFSKWMLNHSLARNDEYTFQLDAIPVALEKFTVEAGAKTIIRRASADYTSLFTFDETYKYTKDNNNSNSFTYRQQVYAGYAALSARFKKNSLRAGIRLEQTGIGGYFSNLPVPVKDNYLSLVPNLYWSRKIGRAISVSLSYNLNLQRPYITNLNPYVNNTDSFNISYGNPELGPQQIHKLVMQLRYNNDKIFVTATLTGSGSRDKILSYRLFDAATGISTTTFGNVGVEQLAGFGINSRYEFSKAFNAGVGGELRYVDVRNRIQEKQHNYGSSGIISGFFNWDVTKHFNLSGSGGMNVSDITLLGRKSPYYFYQVNSGYHIIKDKLYATVNWNNLHGSYYTQHTSFNDTQVDSRTTVKNQYRVIFLGIQYTFGKLHQEVKRKKDVANDDILR